MIKASTGIDVVSGGSGISQPRVSGTHLAHYAPHTPLYLYSASDLALQLDSLIREVPEAQFAVLVWEQEHSQHEVLLKAYLNNLTFIALAMDPTLVAKQLYRLLRDLDQGQYQGILIPSPPKTEAWDAVRDRLQRASFGSGPSSNNHVSN
jgi:L-threonylcarbamoyladenylate synthase